MRTSRRRFILLSIPLILFASQCRSSQPTAPAVQSAPAKAAVRKPAGPPYLGILYSTGDGARSVYRDPYATPKIGARIVEVLPASPAERAGLRIGDTIVSANGEPVVAGDSLNIQIRKMSPGDTLRMVVIRRNGAREIVPAELEPLPATLHR
ncbi:MAG: PDZ domain-containing protein [Leptospirales bacterium]|jgi:S1-C subfamily serine protease